MTNLGKYELLEPLGSGAAADVYRARDTTLDRDVAIKILKPGLVADANAFARFVQEARTAARLFHPNIATVLEIGDAEGRYFIVMRYIPGQSLDKLIREKGSFSWEETLKLAQQIGSALDYAHQQGFLHRDVKPSNIIRMEDGNFILTDFGLTRAMMSTGLTSHTGAVLGTPSYIPPEVWLGQPALPATDQYALACVIYEVMTSKVLFSGETPPAVMHRHFDPRVLPEELPAGFPPVLAEVLSRALDKNPGNRFSGMAEFIRHLEQQSPPAPASDSVSPRIPPSPHRISSPPDIVQAASPAAQQPAVSETKIPAEASSAPVDLRWQEKIAPYLLIVNGVFLFLIMLGLSLIGAW